MDEDNADTIVQNNTPFEEWLNELGNYIEVSKISWENSVQVVYPTDTISRELVPNSLNDYYFNTEIAFVEHE